MSNIYIQEPPTIGKVLLKTSVGDIDIELWSKETPKACRNFIQLCTEGYYNNTIFHRVVKGFIVQGGDPTGTGTGGESIYGQPFKDEFHTRLRFNRRGLVAMANAGKDDNGSQFFFTFAAAPELQNKHTIFGKVTGETVYNMLKLEEALVDEDERPLYPQKIFKAEVLNNPFPDIVPRSQPAKEQVNEAKKKEKKSGVKNFKLLSFGEEAEEDEEENEVANKMYAGRSKSTHDVLNDPKLSAVPAVDMDQKTKKNKNEEGGENDQDDSNASVSEEESSLSGDEEVSKRGWNSDDEKMETTNIRKKLKTEHSHKKAVLDAKESESEEEDYYLGQEKDKEKKRKMEQIRKEIKDLKREMKNDKQNKETEIKLLAAEKKEKEILKEYNETVAKYKQKKQEMPKKGQSREEFTLSLLSKFQKKLAEAKDKAQNISDQGDDKKDDDSNADSESEDWLTHKLQFEEKLPVLAKDASTKDDDWFEIYDPRNPINKRRRETSKNALKNKEKQ